MAERTTAIADFLYTVVLTTFAVTIFGMALLSDSIIAPYDSQSSLNSEPQVTGSIVD